MLNQIDLQNFLLSFINNSLCDIDSLKTAVEDIANKSPRCRKPRNRDLPINLYDTGNGYYRYKHPQTKKSHGLGKDRQQAIQSAHKLNAELLPSTSATERILGQNKTKFSQFLKTFQRKIMPKLGLAKTTISQHIIKLPHIIKALGHHWIDRITVAHCATFLDQYPDNQSNKYRSLLLVVFKHALAKGLVQTNPANATMPKRIKVKRKRLTIDQYQAIYAHAPDWLKNAMDLGLHTLQRREDLATLKWSQIHDRAIWIQQKKVERHGTGNLKISIAPDMQTVLNRCKNDGIKSAYVLHRKPERRIHAKRRDDFTAILPDLITKEFSKTRKATGLFNDYEKGTAPTFHEIRSLGSKLYEKAGMDKSIIQALLGHSSEKMTDVYLDRHEVKWSEVNINKASEV